MLTLIQKRRPTAAFLLCLSLLYTYFWWVTEVQWVVPTLNGTGPLKGKIICLDAGHGGRDPGAVAGRVLEKDINLDITKRVAVLLKKEGARPVLTRTRDKNMAYRPFQGSLQLAGLRERAHIAERSGGHVFVSIHCNSEAEGKYSGPQTFYERGNSRSAQLARLIQEELVQVRSTGRQAIPGDYYLLSSARSPAVIVEVGFLSHARDRSLLTSPPFRQQVAEAIARGILRYFRE
ncbi:MAG: N-acetylmuramoyl-L-alanine amidase family protein [Bacillota bacterium]|uniref:N-acetylmuramoyl-L-alanine amidase family protein n=1 Tax=Thermanaerosceptrum fracticalcis TaxID=1712410 RepID=UPI00068AB8E9|nr:N-acetylmuramoyl-L-alanine amidase [Thermanaerosceptrum fracticalcis]